MNDHRNHVLFPEQFSMYMFFQFVFKKDLLVLIFNDHVYQIIVIILLLKEMYLV